MTHDPRATPAAPVQPTDLAERRRLEGLVALVAVQVFFGLFPVLVKLAAGVGSEGDGFSARALASWRIGLGALVLSVVALARHGRACLPPRADLGRLFLCALLGIVANQLLALEGTVRTSASQAGILFTSIPVFTYVVAAAVGQERLSRRRTLGIVLALAGAVLLVLARREPDEVAPAPVLGGLLLLANCFAYAVYLVLARKLLDHLPTLVVIAWVFVLSLWAPPVLLAFGDGVALWPAAPSRSVLVGFVGLVLLPTILGYLFNTYALARVSASTTAVFVYLQPLVSVGGAVLVLDERPGPAAWLAAALLFAGLALVLVRRGPGADPEPGRRGR